MHKISITRCQFKPFDCIRTCAKRWEDKCQHGDACYVGSVIDEPQLHDARVIDVYAHKYDGELYLCLRTGNEGHEYCSVGTVLDFLAAVAMDSQFYPDVAALVLHEFDFYCERKETHAQSLRK